ncbi:MAG: DoxX family protein [Deltaproteobacteria bacterium]|nr:DoxX family protein [Deltaproteobacteria bacterium]
MDTLIMASQVVVGLGLLNVWLLRFSRSTPWRGGHAKNMREEFAVYGLPSWLMWTVGFMKVSLALLLLAGLWVPGLAKPAALGIMVLMLGALSMHLKISDPWKRSVPALALLMLSVVIALGAIA